MLALVRLFLNLYFSISDSETLQVIFSLLDLKFNGKGEVMQTEKNWTDWSATVVVITRDSHNSRVLEKVFNQTFSLCKGGIGILQPNWYSAKF